ncbi:MAG: SPOR domain-containing protein [Candidatus Margulisiibacteriota bacterium]
MTQHNNQTGLDIPDDEIGVVRGLKRKRPLNIRSIGIAAFVVVLIVSSFWISFFIGKILLSPAKKLPDIDFQKLDERFSSEAQQTVTEESHAVYSPSTVLTPEEKVSLGSEKKEPKRQNPFTPQKKAETKPAEKVLAPRKKAVVPAVVFRVRSSVFDSREKAAELVSRLGDAGFEGFARDESSGRFSVQVGVFKSRSNAERLVQQLKDKGFEGEITE